MKQLICVSLVLGMAGISCGGGEFAGGSSTTDGGRLSLVVKATTPTSGGTERTQIAEYQVVIRGTDFSPLEARFDRATTAATIEGVPVGDGRIIEVTAVNADGEAIRAGSVAGVNIRGGETADVVVALETIPLFLNLREGDVVPNTRLRLQLQGVADQPLAVEAGAVVADEPVTTMEPLLDVARNQREVLPEAATGMVAFAPPRVAPGRYQFRVRDLVTGRASTVTVRVIDGARRRGAPFVAAGSGMPGMPRFGSHFSPRVSRTHGMWPTVVERWQER